MISEMGQIIQRRFSIWLATSLRNGGQGFVFFLTLSCFFSRIQFQNTKHSTIVH